MLEAARGWLTPAVLFVLVNLVIATIAIASRLMALGPAPPGEEAGGPRGLLRAPSFAVDRLRASFSFSRLGLAADQAPVFDYAAAEQTPQQPATAAGAAEIDSGVAQERGEEAVRIERSRSEAAEAAPGKRRPRARRARKTAAAEDPALADLATAGSPAATAREATGGLGARRVGPGGEEPAVEVDERADDFIKRFREQLRLQRLDSILRYRDTLRRTGTA